MFERFLAENTSNVIERIDGVPESTEPDDEIIYSYIIEHIILLIAIIIDNVNGIELYWLK